MFLAHLILRDAVYAHGGDGCEHHSDGEQTEQLARDGVTGVFKRQPQALSDVAISYLLEMLHVSASTVGRKINKSNCN